MPVLPSSTKLYLTREEEALKLCEELEEVGISLAEHWLRFIRVFIKLFQIHNINAKYNNHEKVPYVTSSDAKDCSASIVQLVRELKVAYRNLVNNKTLRDMFSLENLMYSLQLQTLSHYNYLLKTSSVDLKMLVKNLLPAQYYDKINQLAMKLAISDVKFTEEQAGDLRQGYSDVLEGLDQIDKLGLPYVNKAITRLVAAYNVVADFNQMERVVVGGVGHPRNDNIVNVGAMKSCVNTGMQKLLNFIQYPTKENFTVVKNHLWTNLADIMTYNTIYYKLPRIDEFQLQKGDPRGSPKYKRFGCVSKNTLCNNCGGLFSQ